VIVAGDSDYVPLAQRCRRLGRFVVGVGVAGSTAKSLAAACDQFDAYDALPGVARPAASEKKDAAAPRTRKRKVEVDPSADLLERALRLESDKEDADWQHASAVKSLIKRLDPAFSEKALGHKSFSDFVKAHPDVAEVDESGNIVLIRLAPARG
jgi:OST-HTH/LOTUS domain/NYN domain